MAADASPKFHHSPDLLSPDLTMIAQHDGLRFYQYMAAGSLAGVVEHSAMFPIDTLKTRMQAVSRPCRPPLGLRAALLTENPAALYRGLSAMVLGAGPAHAVYFYVYELSKKLLSVNQNPNNPLIHASSGILATVSSDAVFTPMDTIKQRLQLNNSPYKGVMDCIRTVRREEGIGAFFKSYKTTVVMNAPFTAVHFATYEAAKRMLIEVSPQSAEEERLVVHATAGAAAGAIAAAVTTPLDVVKTQLQCQVCFLNQFVMIISVLYFCIFLNSFGLLSFLQLYSFWIVPILTNQVEFHGIGIEILVAE